MRLSRLSAVLLLALTSATPIAVTEGFTQERDVVLEITLPNGNAPQIRITEGKTGSVRTHEGAPTFGFVPTISDELVTVAIYALDSTPHQKLDEVQVAVAGDGAKSKTTPAFGIRAIRIVTR